MDILPLLQSAFLEHTTLLRNSWDAGNEALWSSIPTFTVGCNITQTYLLVRKYQSGLYRRLQDLTYLVARCTCLHHCDKLYWCTVTQKGEKGHLPIGVLCVWTYIYVWLTFMFSLLLFFSLSRFFEVPWVLFLWLGGTWKWHSQSVPYISIYCKDTELFISERTYMELISLTIHDELMSQRILVTSNHSFYLNYKFKLWTINVLRLVMCLLG